MTFKLIENFKLRQEYELIAQLPIRDDKDNYIKYLENLVLQFRKQEQSKT